MSNPSTWETYKSKYLKEVSAALEVSGHPKRRELLDDIGEHLDQRYAELSEAEKTESHFQAILDEMGPAGEYLEFLDPGAAGLDKQKGRRYIVWIAVFVILAFVGAAVCLWAFHEPAGYIFEFKADASEGVTTVDHLLNLFNREVNYRVKTHYYRNEIRSGEIIGLICVDNRAERDGLEQILKSNRRLHLLKIRSASEKDLANLYSMSLPAPRVVQTTPMLFSDNITPDVTAISVTFDQRMMDRSWSWVQFDKRSFPERLGEIYYDGSLTTCTIPCKLEAGTVYEIGINGPNYLHFQNQYGVKSEPYLLVFSTRSANGEPTPIPEELKQKARRINASHQP